MGWYSVTSMCGWDESLLSSRPPADTPLKSPHPQPHGPPQGYHREQPRTLSSLPSTPPPFTAQEHHTLPPHLPGPASGKSQGVRPWPSPQHPHPAPALPGPPPGNFYWGIQALWHQEEGASSLDLRASSWEGRAPPPQAHSPAAAAAASPALSGG